MVNNDFTKIENFEDKDCCSGVSNNQTERAMLMEIVKATIES